jgi:AsmA protein
VSLQTRAAQGLLTLGPVEANLYGGRYQGAFALDARGKAPSLTVETALAKVDVAPLLADVGQGDGISGTLNFEARLTASGNEPRQQVASLSGPASFAVTDGEINGIDLPAVLEAGARMLKSRKQTSAPKGGRTAFHSLTGSLRIEGGVVHNDDLLLDGVGFHVTGKGVMADLNRRRIAYRATLAVPLEDSDGKSSVGLRGFEIPVRCEGELSVSSCKPDLAGLLGKAVKGVVNNGLGRKLEDEARGAGKALRKLLEF